MSPLSFASLASICIHAAEPQATSRPLMYSQGTGTDRVPFWQGLWQETFRHCLSIKMLDFPACCRLTSQWHRAHIIAQICAFSYVITL